MSIDITQPLSVIFASKEYRDLRTRVKMAYIAEIRRFRNEQWKRDSQDAIERRKEKNTPWPISDAPSKSHGDPLRHLITDK